MHVLFIAQQWAPEQGVPQRRGSWMVDQLVRAGHQVSIVASPPHYPGGKLLSTHPDHQPGAVSTSSTGVRVFRSRFFPHTASIYSRVIDQAVVSLSSLLTALRGTRGRRVDVVLVTTPPLPSVFTAFAFARLRRTPFVIDLRDAWPELIEYVPGADPGSWIKAVVKRAIHPAFKLAGKIFSETLKNAHGIITTSAWHAEQLRKNENVRTVVVSNLPLVDLSGAEDTNELVGCTVSQKDELNVLYTGTVGRAQGLENAVIAAALVRERGVRINLRIVGEGAHLKHVLEVAHQVQMDVECTGRIPRENVAEHYAWADTLLVHLQDWKPLEATMPSKMFEAIASGKHVTAAVNGEAAKFLDRFGHGDSVPAMDPDALADLWVQLARNRAEIRQPTNGRSWLRSELERTQPGHTFLNFIEDISRDS